MTDLQQSDATDLEPLVLTFAEVAFLVQPASDERGAELLTRLHLPESASDDGVMASGAASLLARGVLALDQETFTLHPTVEAVRLALIGSDTWIELGVTDGETVGGFQLFLGGTANDVMVAPGPLGTFSVSALDLAQGVDGFIAAVLRETFAGPVGSSVLVRRSQKSTEVLVSAQRAAEDSWMLAIPSLPESSRPFASVDAVVDAVVASLALEVGGAA